MRMNIITRGGLIVNSEIRTFTKISEAQIILLWGAGAQSKSCIDCVKEKTNAEIHLFDSNVKKVGLSISGIVVEESENFSKYLDCNNYVVLISSINKQYEIAQMLVDEYNLAVDVLYGYTSDFYEKNVYRKEYDDNLKFEIETMRSMIQDKESQKYFDGSIRYRFNRNPLELVPNAKMERIGEYADIVRIYEGDTIVDCGAYTGDTAEMYCSYVGNKCTVYAFEPFKDSFMQLEERIKSKHLDNVYAFNYAVSNENRIDKINFNDDDLKMGIRIGEETDAKTELVEVKTIDNVLRECESINFIKMDIEGEEINALQGAINIIKKFAPDVIISAYHKFEHILEIPQFLKSVNPNYKLYVGHAPNVSTEIEIYATVK